MGSRGINWPSLFTLGSSNVYWPPLASIYKDLLKVFLIIRAGNMRRLKSKKQLSTDRSDEVVGSRTFDPLYKLPLRSLNITVSNFFRFLNKWTQHSVPDHKFYLIYAANLKLRYATVYVVHFIKMPVANMREIVACKENYGNIYSTRVNGKCLTPGFDPIFVHQLRDAIWEMAKYL